MKSPPIVRPKSLSALASALLQQSRVWLPQELGHTLAWRTMAITLVVGANVAMLLWSLLPLNSGLARAAAAAGFVAVLAWVLRVQHVRAYATCGWVVDFLQGTLTPVGLASKEIIQINPQEHSLGCFAQGSEDSHSVSYLLELRHVRRGPVAALARVRVSLGQTADLRLLERCASELSQRLAIRRSGATLVDLDTH